MRPSVLTVFSPESLKRFRVDTIGYGTVVIQEKYNVDCQKGKTYYVQKT